MCVTLVIQHAKLMRRVILLCVASLPPPYFSAVCFKRHDLRKKCIEHQLCVLIFSTTLCVKLLILGIIQRDIIMNISRSSCKVAVILVTY
jgi:hypothetical protein